jgi:hypothetical protein
VKKTVLLISPFFAPQSHAAVFRAHKLAKYLARRDWTVHVATVATNYNYNEDPGLVNELGSNVKIHRIKYVEPTLRGLRMLLGGKDRTFKVEKKHVPAPSGNVEVEIHTPSPFQKIYQHLLTNVLQDPDPYWTWGQNVVEYCEDLITSEKIQIVYTTSMPFTTLKVGAVLKEKRNIKWVADFRDPCSYNYRNVSSNKKILANQKAIEEKALRTADALTGLSSCYNLIYRDMYGLSEKREVQFIPTGVDNDYLQNVSAVNFSSPYLVFVGEYLKEYSDYFFKMFAAAKSDMKLVIIGNRNINEKLVAEPVAQLGLEDQVILLDHIPQREVYRWIKGAKAALLISGSSAYWWTNFAKMTDYIAMEKPVLALVPAISEARQELARAQTGIFLDSPEKLKEFFNGLVTVKSNSEYCRRYLATSMCEAFEKIFLSLMS